MQSPVFIFLLVVVSLLILFILRNILINYKNTHRIYAKKGDMDSQKQYLSSKSKDEGIKLTWKEKLDLSWKFLYDITNTVLSKFSETDKQQILYMGKILLENGMKYEHIVDYGLRDSDLKIQEQKRVKSSSSVGQKI